MGCYLNFQAPFPPSFARKMVILKREKHLKQSYILLEEYIQVTSSEIMVMVKSYRLLLEQTYCYFWGGSSSPPSIPANMLHNISVKEETPSR